MFSSLENEVNNNNNDSKVLKVNSPDQIVIENDDNLFDTQPTVIVDEENEDEDDFDNNYSNTFTPMVLDHLIKLEEFRKGKIRSYEDFYNVSNTNLVKGEVSTYHFLPSHITSRINTTEVLPIKESETIFPEITHVTNPSPDGSSSSFFV